MPGAVVASKPLDQLALGEKIGALATTMAANAEIQAEWRAQLKAMIDTRLTTLEGDMREFKAEIRGDMHTLKVNTETGIKSLQDTISGFKMKYTIGKTAVVSAVVVVGAVLVIAALGLQKGIAWMGAKFLSLFG